MIHSVDVIKMAQSILQEKGINVGTIDGIAGPDTAKALNKVKDLPKTWSLERKITGLIQLYAVSRNIDPGKFDGLWGPRTQFAYEQLRHQLLFGEIEEPWRPEEVSVVSNPNNWPIQTRQSMDNFYGVARESGNPNLVGLNLPYPMLLAWDESKVVNKITCHTKVKDSIHRVLTNVLNEYGIERIRDLRLHYFGGCFNFRAIRGGTELSTHSWAIALDFDPINNQLKWGRDRATFARPDYKAWWEFWEQEGWVSLGRQRNFDWMHVQAAKLVS